MKFLLALFILIITIAVNGQEHKHVEPLKCGHISHQAQQEFNTLMDDYDVTCYFIDITASDKSVALSGNTSIYANSKVENLETFVFELNKLIAIDSIHVNGTSSNFSRKEYETSVNVTDSIAKGDNFEVKIFYQRPGSLNSDGIFNRFEEKWGEGGNVTYTLSEPYYAREWFPVKQDLHDKADSVFVFVTVDNHLKVGSNGLLINTKRIGDTMVRYEWKSYYPIAYYLISIAVAEYEEYNFYAHPKEIAPDSILVQNYLYKDYSENDIIKEEFDWTDELIELFSEKYSIYPFWKEKYGHSFVPLGGAMEHQTMTTTGSSTFYINAHELGHQWFGDQVTCASWQDIWINEGFASYSEYLAYEFLYSKSIAQEHLVNAQYYAREAKTGSVYIPFEELDDKDRIFDWKLTYRKGLCLVHMIRSEINDDDRFFELLQGFQNKYANSVASGDDFKEYLNDSSEVNFNNFFDEWYYGEGYPTYQIVWDTIGTGIQFAVNQTTEVASTPFFTNSLLIQITSEDTSFTLRIKPSDAIDTIFIDSVIRPGAELTLTLDSHTQILKGEDSFIIHKDDITSTKLIAESSIRIGPNPYNNYVKIESLTETWNHIVINDILGKKHWESDQFKGSIELSTNKWPVGVYIVTIYTDNGKEIMKLIKQ